MMSTSYHHCLILVCPGHIGFAVPDVDKACERFEKMEVKFVKKPNNGNHDFLSIFLYQQQPMYAYNLLNMYVICSQITLHSPSFFSLAKIVQVQLILWKAAQYRDHSLIC